MVLLELLFIAVMCIFCPIVLMNQPRIVENDTDGDLCFATCLSMNVLKGIGSTGLLILKLFGYKDAELNELALDAKRFVFSDSKMHPALRKVCEKVLLSNGFASYIGIERPMDVCAFSCFSLRRLLWYKNL
ncbi:hypothetical protein DPMN_139962 [Dreissena polymorpha]|uniref:Uncharacterized protein n=1 Tax=Dreissena polymorpha TaxID=45954 RepID=A0A9D4JLA5_DREPO|nr:hypothetical protein DPMN_139962 [Dreissena polymorpha]